MIKHNISAKLLLDHLNDLLNDRRNHLEELKKENKFNEIGIAIGEINGILEAMNIVMEMKDE